MKFAAATTFLACLVSQAFAQDPLTAFTLGDTFDGSYDSGSNVFSLAFDQGTQLKPTKVFTHKFLTYDCETAILDSSDGLTSINWGFPDSTWTNLPTNNNVAVTSATPYPVHQFQIDMGNVKGSTTPTPPNAVTGNVNTLWNENGSTGLSTIQFCVRSIIGTTNFEVNFIEAQVTIVINLVTGVATDVAVEKRIPFADVGVEEQYQVDCYICSTTPVNQGKMVDVCMIPASEDVKLISLLDFAWTQYEPGNAVPRTVLASQTVVDVNTPDTKANPLSTDSDCPVVQPTLASGTTCGFKSMMRASFYDREEVPVDGAGNVLLTLARRNRRLNEAEPMWDDRTKRLLQGVGGEVGVQVPLSNEDTGPGALKTAGGASFGTGLASGIALLGAVLFA